MGRAQGPSDLATLRANLLASYVLDTNFSGADADIATWLPLILPNGTFSDLNYTYAPNAAFDPWTHALRMQEMGSVYVTPNCSHFQNPVLGRGINATFGFWLWAQPTSQNWCGSVRALGEARQLYLQPAPLGPPQLNLAGGSRRLVTRSRSRSSRCSSAAD